MAEPQKISFNSFEEYFRNEPIYGGYKVFLKEIPGFDCSVQMECLRIDEGKPVWGTPVYSYKRDNTDEPYQEYSFYSREKLTNESLLNNNRSLNPSNPTSDGWVPGVSYNGEVSFCEYTDLLNLAKINNNLESVEKSKSFVKMYESRITSGTVVLYEPDSSSDSILDRILCNSPDNKSLTVSFIALDQIPTDANTVNTIRMTIVSNKQIGKNNNNIVYGMKTYSSDSSNSHTYNRNMIVQPFYNPSTNTITDGSIGIDSEGNVAIKTSATYAIEGKYLITFSWTDDSDVTPEPTQSPS